MRDEISPHPQDELPKRINSGKGGASAAAAAAAAESRRRAGIATPAADSPPSDEAPQGASGDAGAPLPGAADGAGSDGDEEGAEEDDEAGDDEAAAPSEDGLPGPRRRRRVVALARFTADGVQYSVRGRTYYMLRSARGSLPSTPHEHPTNPNACAILRVSPPPSDRERGARGRVPPGGLPSPGAARRGRPRAAAGGPGEGLRLRAGPERRPAHGWRRARAAPAGGQVIGTVQCTVGRLCVVLLMLSFRPARRGRRQAGGARVPRGEESARGAHPAREGQGTQGARAISSYLEIVQHGPRDQPQE